MRQFPRFLPAFLAALALIGIQTGPATAQNLFRPVIQVNEMVITEYEFNQRTLFLQLLGAPGDARVLAREQLIEDRLKLDAAHANGLKPDPAAVQAGLEEFASRANLTAEEFIKALNGAGVSAQTYRDFVTAGIVWRDLARAKFGPRVTVSDTDVERAQASTIGGGTAARVLLSEIIMNAPKSKLAEVQARADKISKLRSLNAFSDQARQFSDADSADNGGQLEWMNLSALPAELRAMILGLAPGQVSPPIPQGGKIALYQMRKLEQREIPAGQYASIDYAAYYLAGGRSEATLAQAARIRTQADTCDDLYGIAKDQPAEVLERANKAPGEIPADIARELSVLDKGESSTALTRNNGQTLVFLMLCSRTTAIAATASIEDFALGLQNRRLEAMATGYLAELRDQARIVNR